MRYKMKLIAVVTTTFFFPILTGCGNTSELEEIIENQEVEISLQDERITELEQQLGEQAQLISDFEAEIELLSQEVENTQPNFTEFEEGLISDLEDNIEALLIPFFGRDLSFIYPSPARVSFNEGSGISGQVMVYVSSSGRFQPAVILSFQLELEVDVERHISTWTTEDWNDVEVDWEVMGYVFDGDLRLAYEREPRLLTDLETVTIRIYEFYRAVEWRYHEEVIVGSELWIETRRLLPEVRDLWYEGSALYVDLMLSETRSVGATGADLPRMDRLALIFSSFPHVSEVRFSTMGRPRFYFGAQTGQEHSAVFNVEEKRWMMACELEEDDVRFSYSEVCEHWFFEVPFDVREN